MLVKDMPKGSILWDNKLNEDDEYDILGIAGVNIPEDLMDKECKQLPGNPVDYEII